MKKLLFIFFSFTFLNSSDIQKAFLVAVYDENSYNGRYFAKDDKIWIHNIKALKSQLNTDSDYRLKKLGYDVDTYYKLH